LKIGVSAAGSSPVRIELNWKRPLFYLVLPIILFICFLGFPPPFPPLRETRPAQEQGVPEDDEKDHP
jgi:hypothetical protein